MKKMVIFLIILGFLVSDFSDVYSFSSAFIHIRHRRKHKKYKRRHHRRYYTRKHRKRYRRRHRRKYHRKHRRRHYKRRKTTKSTIFHFRGSYKTTIVRVIDGDTYVTSSGTRIRLAYVDTFEIHRGARLRRQAIEAHISVRKALWLGFRAKHYAQKKLLGKRVRVIPHGRGKYGRLIAEIKIKGRDFGWLLEKHRLTVGSY